MMNVLTNEMQFNNAQLFLTKMHRQVSITSNVNIDVKELIKIMNAMFVNSLKTIFESDEFLSNQMSNTINIAENMQSNEQIKSINNTTTEQTRSSRVISISRAMQFQLIVEQCSYCHEEEHRRMICSHKKAAIAREKIYEQNN